MLVWRERRIEARSWFFGISHLITIWTQLYSAYTRYHISDTGSFLSYLGMSLFGTFEAAGEKRYEHIYLVLMSAIAWFASRSDPLEALKIFKAVSRSFGNKCMTGFDLRAEHVQTILNSD